MQKRGLDSIIKLKKKELINITGYKQPDFPKYTSPLINLLNRWARETHSSGYWKAFKCS